MFLNIELKAPKTKEILKNYNIEKAAQTVYDLLIKYDMHGKFQFSSFSFEQLGELQKIREKNEKIYERFDIIYLYNYHNKALPSPDEYLAIGDGINISANHITQEVVDHCKRKGKKVGVWIRT